MSTSSAAPARPPPLPVRGFVIVVVIAILLTVTVFYLGSSGKIDLGIPGEKPPPSHSGTDQGRVVVPAGPREAFLDRAGATSVRAVTEGPGR